MLRRLEIDVTDPPPAGTKLKSLNPEAADAAEIVGAAFSPALQKIVAMAYVRTQFAEPGTDLSLGDARAHVK